MDRYVLSDAQWAKMQPHCLGKKSDPDRSGEDNRRFVEAVLWIARTGSPWRDLPPLFGPWNTVFKRYRDWVKADVFKRLFDAASEQPDMEYASRPRRRASTCLKTRSNLPIRSPASPGLPSHQPSRRSAVVARSRLSLRAFATPQNPPSWPCSGSGRESTLYSE